MTDGGDRAVQYDGPNQSQEKDLEDWEGGGLQDVELNDDV